VSARAEQRLSSSGHPSGRRPWRSRLQPIDVGLDFPVHGHVPGEVRVNVVDLLLEARKVDSDGIDLGVDGIDLGVDAIDLGVDAIDLGVDGIDLGVDGIDLGLDGGYVRLSCHLAAHRCHLASHLGDRLKHVLERRIGHRGQGIEVARREARNLDRACRAAGGSQ